VVLAGGGGCLLAGIINKAMSLTVEQKLRAMMFLALISLVAMLMFAVQCDVAPLADLTSYYQQSDRYQGLWRIEYLNTGRANSPKIWLFSLVPVAPQLGVVVAN